MKPTEQIIFRTLVRCGPLSVKQLAKAVGSDKDSIKRLLGSLEGSGFIQSRKVYSITEYAEGWLKENSDTYNLRYDPRPDPPLPLGDPS